MEKMLVTRALDERDLLVKKINDKIEKASFVDTVKANEESVLENRMSREAFADKAQSTFQQIGDLIERFRKIDAAIVASNARTVIKTTHGEMTVAGAISLRSRLKGGGTYNGEADFEGSLQRKMESELQKRLQFAELKNKQLQTTAEEMRLSILGKDSKVKDEKPLAVVEAYVKENTTQLADPVDVKTTVAKLKEKRETLLSELDTQIKVSNATTFLEF